MKCKKTIPKTTMLNRGQKSRSRKNGDVHYLLFCSRTIQIIKASEVQKVEEMRRIAHLHLLAVTKLLN